MGLPNIIIEFLHNAETAIKRSGNGVVALIYNATTPQTKVDEYKMLIQLGGAKKVILQPWTADESDALNILATKKWDYLVSPDSTSTGVTLIKNWIIDQRSAEHKKTFKAVLPNCTANHEGIVNFTTTGIFCGEVEYTTEEFACRIAGIIAGCPLDKSITYQGLGEVTAIDEPADPDGDINAGKLILINDGEKIKIARGINSLTTPTGNQTDDYKNIKIVEGMDMVKNDIRSTFEDDVVGIANNYYSTN